MNNIYLLPNCVLHDTNLTDSDPVAGIYHQASEWQVVGSPDLPVVRLSDSIAHLYEMGLVLSPFP